MMQAAFESIVGLLPGLWTSIQMTVVAVLFGIPLGFLAGIALNSTTRSLRYPVIALVEIFRGFPALLTLYLVYFGLAGAWTVDRFVSVVIAFGITVAAYSAEIFRAAIASVPSGHVEAARALALTERDTVLKITIPHVVRVVLPPIIGIIIIAFQGTALAYAIGAKELLGTAYSAGMIDFNLLPQLMLAAVLYLAVTTLLSGLEAVAARRAARISGRPVPRRRRVRLASSS